MESVNFFKGYGKVNSFENPSSFATRRKRQITIAVSLAVLLTIVIGAMIGALVHESKAEDHESEQHASTSSLSSSSASESLKIVCSVTQYPDSCVSSISPLNTPPNTSPNPVHFFNLSLQVTMAELVSLSSLPKSLISKVNDPRTTSALRDCSDLFDDSVSQVRRSAELMKVTPGEKVLTEMKISNIQTWVSAAMTDEDTCLEGLDEMGSTVVDEVKAKVQKSKEYMSNTLAILNNIQSLLQKFGLPMP